MDFCYAITLMFAAFFLQSRTSAVPLGTEPSVEHVDIPSQAAAIHEQSFTLQFNTSDGPLTFDLTRDNDHHSNVPVFINNGDGMLRELKPTTPELETVVFRDVKTGSSFAFQYMDDGRVDVHGRYVRDNQLYTIRPSSTERRRRRSANAAEINLHAITLDHLYSDMQHDYVVSADYIDRRQSQPRINGAVKAAGLQERWIEALVTADSDIYENHRRCYAVIRDTSFSFKQGSSMK